MSDASRKRFREGVAKCVLGEHQALAVSTDDIIHHFLIQWIQTTEVDDLDTLSTAKPARGNTVYSGVEVDGVGRIVAYHLWSKAPDGTQGKLQRLDARRVIYLATLRRPSQVREISRLTPTLQRIKDLNEYLEAVAVKERVAACLAVAVTTQAPASTLGRGLSNTTDATSGYDGQTVTPGMFYYLAPGEDVKSIVPPASGGGARDFVNLHQRIAGAAQGLSYEATTRDMSEVNYSSARQGRLEDQAEYDMLAQFLIEHLLNDVYEEFLFSCVSSGKLPIDDYSTRREDYTEHTFMPPGLTWIDPLKEIKADQEAVRVNLDTLANRCARRGLDWREVMAQRKRERDLERELGIETDLAPVEAPMEINSA
jgi:lambda family phage portal protein